MHHEASKHSQRTIEYYGTQLPPFVAWLQAQEVTTLQQIRSSHIRAYLVQRSEDGLAQHSVHAVARALRAFLRFCVNEEWLLKSPMTGVTMPKVPKPVPTVLTRDQIKKLVGAAETERDQAIILFLLDTGIRASELCALRGRDVDVGDGTVWIRYGKGAKDRVTFIGAKTVKALLRYYAVRSVPKDGDPVFISEKRKEHLTRFGISQLMRYYSKNVGFECNAHKLRRTFATSCLRSGMDLYALARLMGHSDLTVLRHYLAILDGDLREQHRRHGVVDNI